MYLIYIDESGDCGLKNSPTRYFALSGLVVHELRWKDHLEDMLSFRRQLRVRYGLKLREEFHASHFITKPGELRRIPRDQRLAMIREFATFLSRLRDINIINVVVDKAGKPERYGVFENAWQALIQRFENTISNHNFPGPANPDERGMILCDHTDDKKLFPLIRQMRRYNPVPNQPECSPGYRNLPLSYVIEDPVLRNSAHYYFIQAADLAAFLLYQYFQPNVYLRRKAGHRYLLRLDPVLCKVASPKHPLGIVML